MRATGIETMFVIRSGFAQMPATSARRKVSTWQLLQVHENPCKGVTVQKLVKDNSFDLKVAASAIERLPDRRGFPLIDGWSISLKWSEYVVVHGYTVQWTDKEDRSLCGTTTGNT